MLHLAKVNFFTHQMLPDSFSFILWKCFDPMLISLKLLLSLINQQTFLAHTKVGKILVLQIYSVPYAQGSGC